MTLTSFISMMAVRISVGVKLSLVGVKKGKVLNIGNSDWYTPVSKPSLKNVIVYKQALPFDSLEKIQHVIHEIARVAVSDKSTVAIPADDAIELGVEIFKL